MKKKPKFQAHLTVAYFEKGTELPPLTDFEPRVRKDSLQGLRR